HSDRRLEGFCWHLGHDGDPERHRPAGIAVSSRAEERGRHGSAGRLMARGIPFANLVLAGLLAGTMFGIWLGYDPRNLSAAAFVEQHQNAVRALNITMPVLGAICIALTIVHAYL